ncbi:MAG: hypothetical protein G3M78_00645 [Candidatus Nitrohelix vancouverensis]|uniref:Uncharacterized protein n=1 Tax=Candidatus Nitrohelix vancouverensis TaxID=2705534 RepID=A0A7T0G290_9BACT|nr:MAG: hypothetical protein G3M78_00645 [Candidatus Nitrohelix vancouverensis]
MTLVCASWSSHAFAHPGHGAMTLHEHDTMVPHKSAVAKPHNGLHEKDHCETHGHSKTMPCPHTSGKPDGLSESCVTSLCCDHSGTQGATSSGANSPLLHSSQGPESGPGSSSQSLGATDAPSYSCDNASPEPPPKSL